MADKDLLGWHEDKLEERSQLNARRDTDVELVTSFHYVLRDLKDKAISDVLSVTMNRLRVFKAFVEASLNKADEKVVVTSNDEAIDTATIEDYIKSCYRQANSRLQGRGQFLIEPYIDQQSVIRGEAANEILFQMVDAEGGAFLDTSITNWDTRYVTYERGIDGLSRAGYEINKTAEDINSEKWAIEANFTSKDEAKVIQIWTPEENVFYVDDKLVFSQPNPYLFVPVVVQGVPIGSMLADKDSLQYQWESIFFLVRDLINEYNMCLSVLQTLNLKAIKVALQQPLKTGQEASEYDDVSNMGSVTPTEVGQIGMVPYGDAKNSMILALQEINKALDDGTLSRITLGDLPGELSAVALIQVEQGQGQVFMPRLGNRGLLKKQGSEMFIKQTIGLGVTSVEVGTTGHKREFKVSDLEGQYDIDYRYTSKNPDTEFARTRMAKEQVNVIPELAILTDTLVRDDPDGDQNKLTIQRAVEKSPTLQKYVSLMALREEEDKGSIKAADMADLLEQELNITIEQLQAGKIPGEEQPDEALPPEGPRNSNQAAQDLISSSTNTLEASNG